MMNTFGPRGKLRFPARNEAARDPGREFVQFFGPVVYAVARKRGFDDTAAADLMREALTRAARDAGRGANDPGHDTVRARLTTATSSAMAVVRGAGSTAAFEPGGPGFDADWESEFQRQLARSAMDSVKRECPPREWEAFWMAAVDGRAEAAVGRELRMTAGEVHVAKCRVRSRLREEIRRLRLETALWCGTAARSADQPADRTPPDRNRSGPRAPIAPADPDIEDIDRTPLHVPCCSRW
ncbi:sigma-70 family RNA polymerase sigma factor [Gemmata sp. JC717]|uniref:RNA polymerase sigma factor n=1 Tax=Gemmata algarum TaxID=2975278 RepID=UPI0021BB0FE2|nr:sigma-70 family RNA polymerase sigma factor [Gemmata algarum]MDY3552923.1 sigma-70 family RNA polymerase sigma factor [Gemmata algarum]